MHREFVPMALRQVAALTGFVDPLLSFAVIAKSSRAADEFEEEHGLMYIASRSKQNVIRHLHCASRHFFNGFRQVDPSGGIIGILKSHAPGEINAVSPLISLRADAPAQFQNIGAILIFRRNFTQRCLRFCVPP